MGRIHCSARLGFVLCVLSMPKQRQFKIVLPKVVDFGRLLGKLVSLNLRADNGFIELDNLIGKI